MVFQLGNWSMEKFFYEAAHKMNSDFKKYRIVKFSNFQKSADGFWLLFSASVISFHKWHLFLVPAVYENSIYSKLFSCISLTPYLLSLFLHVLSV